MQRLVYISGSSVNLTDVGSAASDFASWAQIKNRPSGVSGALIFTDKIFAQVLEGNHADIEAMLVLIESDKHHENVVVIDKSPISQRVFADWQIAYQGCSQYVSRHLAGWMNAPSCLERQRASAWITVAASEFLAIRAESNQIV